MRELTKRPVVRLLSPLMIVALMWLPGAAQAGETGTDPGTPTTQTTVLPLLGSNLTVAIVTDADGAVTSVTVDGQAVDFEQQDDEISFLYTVEGQTVTVTVEISDDDQGDEADDSDQAEAGDDHQGDQADDSDQAEAGDDDQGQVGDDDQGDEADGDHEGDQAGDEHQGDETGDHQGDHEHEDDDESEGGK